MASVNRVILLGNLGRDVELRYTQGGDAVANINIATTERWKSAGGEAKEKTEWHRVILFGRQAEVAGEFLKKGAAVYIEGRLQTRKWIDKEGADRYTTEIVADRMQMLGGKRGDEGDAESAPAQSSADAYRNAKEGRPPPIGGGSRPDDGITDDIPF